MPLHRLSPLATALIIGTAAIAASVASAQQGNPGAHFLENWDLNADGKVSLSETKTKRAELFVMFDSDENGVLDSDEYDLFDETRRADMNENAGGHKKGGMRGVDKTMRRGFNDIDGDGLVSEDEFMTKAEDGFKMMDRTGDGVVTPDDFARKDG